MIRRIALAAIVALVVAYVPQPAAAEPPGITLVDLGAADYKITAVDVNDRGQILVYTYPGGFLWEHGVVTPIEPPPVGYWSPRAINNQGHIVGWCYVGTATHALLWEDGVTTDLGLDGFPMDINDGGQVVGYTAGGSPRAFLWEDGETTYLAPDWVSSYALGINPRGQVVGYGQPDSTSTTTAFVWQNGGFTYLAPLSDVVGQGSAAAINAAGLVVGSSLDATYYRRAVMWQDGSAIDLGALEPTGNSFARAVNDRGQIVGYGAPGQGGYHQHALLWEAGALTELDGFANDAEALAINNRGWVVGRSRDVDGRNHAVLWIVM